jgi:hypothetical protein
MMEVNWHCGPLAVLIVGKVWAVDIGRRGVFGVGWRIRFRKVAP